MRYMTTSLEKLILPGSRSTGKRDMKRASDCDSKKNQYSTSWCQETHRKPSSDMSGVFPRPFAQSWPDQVSIDVRHNYSVPGDPRLPSAEGFSLFCCLSCIIKSSLNAVLRDHVWLNSS